MDLVILGGNTLHKGFEEIRRKLDIDSIIVIDWNKHPPFFGDLHFQCDIKDTEAILKLPIDFRKVGFVYTSADVAVLTQCKLHKSMGLLTPDESSVFNALIKGRSTDCWRKAGILGKESNVISSKDEILIDGNLDYIIKPNCSSGSRGITILRKNRLTKDDIISAYNKAALASSDGHVIVEEFCHGTEYTIEMLGDNYGNVSVFGISKKYHTPYNQDNKIATKLHYCPNDVSDSELQRIATFGQSCYRAVGLKNSMGHLEVIICGDGRIVPIEIGARSTGFVATHLLDAINHDCMLKTYSEVIRGSNVQDGIVFDLDKSSMYYFYDIRPGIGKHETNLTEYLPKGIKTLAWDREALKCGNEFRVIAADHERFGYEILSGSRNILTINNIIKAEEKFNDRFIG